MSTELNEKELPSEERKLNRDAVKAAKELKKGRTYDNWMALGPTIMAARAYGLRFGAEKSPAYIKARQDYLDLYPDVADLNDPRSKVFSHIAWLLNPEPVIATLPDLNGKTRQEIAFEIREDMRENDPARFAQINSPQMMAQLVKERLQNAAPEEFDPEVGLPAGSKVDEDKAEPVSAEGRAHVEAALSFSPEQMAAYVKAVVDSPAKSKVMRAVFEAGLDTLDELDKAFADRDVKLKKGGAKVATAAPNGEF